MRGSSSSSTSLKPLACKTHGTSPVGRKASRPSGRNVTSFWQQWRSGIISGHQWSSVAISVHQWHSVALSSGPHQWQSVAISGNQWSFTSAPSESKWRNKVPLVSRPCAGACLREASAACKHAYVRSWRRGEHLHARARARARGRRTRPAGMCQNGAVVSTRLVLDGAISMQSWRRGEHSPGPRRRTAPGV
jgi:hypothetical protein